jgi:hypothetical protein
MITHKRLPKNSAIEAPRISHDILVLERLSFFVIPQAATLNVAAAVVIANMPYPRSCRVTGRHIEESVSRK